MIKAKHYKNKIEHNIRLHKVSAVILVVAIVFTTVFSVSMIASANTSFSPRTSAPSKSNEYYYSNKNIFFQYGYGMPNCTAYAYGRAYEILKSEPKLCRYNAYEWYDYNKNGKYYDYGSTPKLGAIACWSYSGSGHVAVVEKIENGVITFSNSAYGGSNFYLTTAKTSDSNPGQSGWNFQGYIYIGNFEQTTTTASTAKTGIYTVKVDDSLNMRSGAGTSYSIIASIPNGAKLTVTKTAVSGTNSWGYTTYNNKTGWVALDYCVYTSEIVTTTAKPTTQPTTVKPTTQPTTAKQTTQPTTIKATTVPTTAKPTQIQQTTQVTVATTQSGDTPFYDVGDVNEDGIRSIHDVSLLQKYLAGGVTFTERQKKNSDFNFDGIVDVNDITLMQKVLAGKW